jgi:HAD superfamily hydrolase (TIGR01509 family)
MNFKFGGVFLLRFLDKEVEAVIFDMDGTLFDTEALIIRLYLQISQKYGKPIKLPVLHRCIGMTGSQTIKTIKEMCGEDYPYEKIKKEVNEKKMEYIHRYGMPMKEGVQETLAFLKQHKIPIALATSTHRNTTMEYLKRANLENVFSTVICGDEVVKGKPEPEMIWKVCERLKQNVESCIVLEDSEYGILAALKGGSIPVFIKDIKLLPKELSESVFMSYESMRDFLKDLKFMG